MLAKEKYNLRERDVQALGATFVPFSAQTRMSGVDLPTARRSVIRKGAAERDRSAYVAGTRAASFPPALQRPVDDVARRGSTPLVVADGTHGARRRSS